MVVLVADINECGAKPAICGKYAKCQNIASSYRCHCNLGFSRRARSRVCLGMGACIHSPAHGRTYGRTHTHAHTRTRTRKRTRTNAHTYTHTRTHTHTRAHAHAHAHAHARTHMRNIMHFLGEQLIKWKRLLGVCQCYTCKII